MVEFTGLPQSPDKITASVIEACHVLLVGERDGRGACAASQKLRADSVKGGVAGALRRASSGRSSLAWKPVRHYYSHKCSCLEPHAGRRADIAVHLLCILALLALLATAPCLSPMLSLCSTCAVAEATC